MTAPREEKDAGFVLFRNSSVIDGDHKAKILHNPTLFVF